MTIPTEYTYARYLAAKKSVDDRALNQHVWQQMTIELQNRQRITESLSILEFGAGIGTMIERLLDDNLLRSATYTALDELDKNTRVADSRIQQWAAQNGWHLEHTDGALALAHYGDAGLAPKRVDINLRTAELFDFLQQQKERPKFQQTKYDLLIANAFLDLVDAPAALALMLPLLKSNGLVYFSINFDGATIFEPPIAPAFDAQIEQLYHRTMDERVNNGKPSGHSQTGRQLFRHLRDAGVEILAAGSSDWVVHAIGENYLHDEAYFLHFIVDTVRGALTDHPELEQGRFMEWITKRHNQVEAGELVYVAHQLDFFGSVHGE